MIYDLIIIGTGPAGLTAAIYAERARLNTLVIEKNYMSGGQVLNTYEVDNYPGLQGIGGFEMSEKFREHAQNLGASFKETEVLEVVSNANTKLVKTTAGDFETKTVLIAAGANHRKLGIPGEEELSGMGVSYCATCDGAFFKNKVTAVVGGGDVAAEDAIFLARLCKKVYVIHRRKELRAAKALQEKLFALDNVEMLWDTVVNRIEGKDRVEQIEIENVETKEKKELALDGIFVAVGIMPNSSVFTSLVQTDEQNYLIAGEDCRTSAPGIYAAGDIRTKQLRQIITAAADGANAVYSIQKDLNN